MRLEVVERCAADAKTKESDILRMALAHGRPSNLDALFCMCSFYMLTCVLDAVPDIAGKSATNVVLSVARAQRPALNSAPSRSR